MRNCLDRQWKISGFLHPGETDAGTGALIFARISDAGVEREGPLREKNSINVQEKST